MKYRVVQNTPDTFAIEKRRHFLWIGYWSAVGEYRGTFDPVFVPYVFATKEQAIEKAWALMCQDEAKQFYPVVVWPPQFTNPK